MSTATQPTIDVLKQELSRLHSFTSEIGKAQEVATQAQAAALAVIEAAEAVDLKNRQLVDALKTEHLRSIQEQTGILRKASTQQATEAKELIKEEIGDLRQGAESAAKVLQQVLDEQPRILATIAAHHKQEGADQATLLRETIEGAITSLNKEVGARLLEFHQVNKSFDVSATKQIDVLTSITDRLQVISGSLTAFRDAMNASKFTDRLESLESQQQKAYSLIQTNQSTLLNALAAIDSIQQHSKEAMATVSVLKRQNMLLQGIILAGIVGLAVLSFLK